MAAGAEKVNSQFIYRKLHVGERLHRVRVEQDAVFRGNPAYLMEQVDSKDEIWNRVLQPTNHEIYVDLGAYNGDTIREFCSLWPEHSRIFAMEPDRKNFRKLVSNTMDIPYTTLCNACSGFAEGSAYFAQKAGRNSSISQKGNIKVPMYTVDSMVCDSHVSYIKMDVEGNEEE